MNDNKLTGLASIDRPWMKYYPEQIAYLRAPECTLLQYLKTCCGGEDLTVIHFYGEDIKWATFFKKVEDAARSLRALGLKEGDQIPVFLQSVPEFFYLLLGAEKIGASLLCRDNTLEENVMAVRKSGAKIIFAHDYLSQDELNAYFEGSDCKQAILIPPLASGSYDAMPDYVQRALDSRYPDTTASGEETMTWNEFLALGESFTGTVEAPEDYNRPLLRAYTSGSTGPSKQVIHSAYTMAANICQMNPRNVPNSARPVMMHTILPPSLIAAVVSMMLLPMASNYLLILDPFCDPMDVDLEFMRYRPNMWPLIPMFIERIVHSGRIPDDYDMSHLFAAGVGAEAYNNRQIKLAQQFLDDHNCHIRLTTGYGSSEAGSSVCNMPLTPHPVENGVAGIPMPLNIVGIFKFGTQEELGYNELGEICVSGPSIMLGYDNPEATAKALQKHEDGRIWLHMGDKGYMNEDGVVYALTRGTTPRFGGGDLPALPMENLVADANCEGIIDDFFVNVPDKKHPGCYLPYLYVVLKEGYTVDDIAEEVVSCLEPHMRPVDIIQVDERPFFHFKTNRVGLTQELLASGY
ncbi:MAG: acyl--CoA ligase [Clostridiales bacterium]|nr:acyl--CoA ligase [Clostridiales bacterium]